MHSVVPPIVRLFASTLTLHSSSSSSTRLPSSLPSVEDVRVVYLDRALGVLALGRNTTSKVSGRGAKMPEPSPEDSELRSEPSLPDSSARDSRDVSGVEDCASEPLWAGVMGTGVSTGTVSTPSFPRSSANLFAFFLRRKAEKSFLPILVGFFGVASSALGWGSSARIELSISSRYLIGELSRVLSSSYESTCFLVASSEPPHT
mmetsp:Transcript_57479/g.171493  ORF Transcript_57479/g.171493 Transcript_57479/m.171493 type:complete len:204 (-) Transcript_57479:2313-2924(-)